MYTVKFDFDPESESVSNVKVTKIASKFDNTDLAIVQLGDSKLVLSPKAVELLELPVGGRVSVNYIQKSNELTFPVIAKSEKFADPDSGNKLTIKNTIAFRGTQKQILSKYGNLFELKEYKDGIYKMVQIDESELSHPELESEINELKEI